ncbi:MAG: hypothetical protein ACT4OW_02060 [Nitrososphaerota archaeon]
MKQGTTILALLGIAIISAGLTFAVAQNDVTSPDLSAPLPKAGSFVNGHVKVFLYDENGNLKAYRESDNVITNFGLEAIIMQTFGNWTANPSSLDSGQNNFNLTAGAPARAGAVKSMAIGIGGETAAASGQRDLVDRTGLGSCANQTAAFKLSNGGGNQDPNTAKLLVIVTNATFSGSASCNVNSVDEVGLFTRTPTGGGGTGILFARQTFSAVNIGASDTLTINWDITFQDT